MSDVCLDCEEKNTSRKPIYSLTKLLLAGLLVYSYVMTSKLIGPQVLNGIRACEQQLAILFSCPLVMLIKGDRIADSSTPNFIAPIATKCDNNTNITIHHKLLH